MKRLSDHQLQDLEELGFPLGTLVTNNVIPELMPDEVIIDIPDDDAPPRPPEPIPVSNLAADVWFQPNFQGEWELPEPYMYEVDKFT
eukprot:6320045-Amphidinium_carterae.2